ncbi:hypothetical protein SAMN05421824_2698 [Hyunsoonleella jejuensis]|uniref:Uncharacterized protein n=1 Tax=Hyunsoonleella jejuensis TaxID=419940 RepID=A0A1H9KC72_9FLAO|nr:DUF6090 family protein [Hyunsoonleella jejuensis]SEQ96796.1 hypothetical protein SAMN05421824_2698 [Hyunsoonleella jejuensis]
MIKFFRKIRKKLLSENKFSKYILYAIGEIILVVIGILIALQINSKKEEINNRIVEQSILNNLKEDFNKNQQEIEVLIFANNKYHRNLNKFIEILKTTPKDIKVKIDDTLAIVAIAAPTYIPTTSTIDVIISTGKIDLIKNEELKTLISRFKREVADLSEDEKDVRILANIQICPLLGQNSDMIDVYQNTYPYTVDRFNKIKLSSSSMILNSNLLGSLIAQRFYYNKMILNELNSISEMQKEILQLINSEIDTEE